MYYLKNYQRANGVNSNLGLKNDFHEAFGTLGILLLDFLLSFGFSILLNVGLEKEKREPEVVILLSVIVVFRRISKIIKFWITCIVWEFFKNWDLIFNLNRNKEKFPTLIKKCHIFKVFYSTGLNLKQINILSTSK